VATTDSSEVAVVRPRRRSGRSDVVTDVALLSPLFLVYHLGVVFLPVRNAADLVTSRLADLAEHSRLLYLGLTLLIGTVVVATLLAFGHHAKLRLRNFAFVALEGITYALLMRLLAAFTVQQLALAQTTETFDLTTSPFTALIMSCGAGLYEELAFRAVLFDLGARFFLTLDDWNPWIVRSGWAVLCAAGFSAWHHLGAMGEPFALRPFVFRTVCGLVFTGVYWFRGLSPAVWTHTLYDAWVLL